MGLDAYAREQIGERYNLVKKSYTWDSIADKMVQLYSWLTQGGNKPEFVMMD